MGSGSISLPLRGAFHRSLTVLSTIGLTGVFSLAGWSRPIHAGLLVTRATQDTTHARHTTGTGLSPSQAGRSSPFSFAAVHDCVVLQPRRCVATPAVWAVPRSLATTQGITDLFSLPPGTKMFQFPGFASIQQRMDSRPSGGWVVPFGNPGINGHLRLHRAYRSLSRPSSPP